MGNIFNKLSSPSSICYFYIILLFTSIFIDPEYTGILSLFTITSTLISIVILLELKKQINMKLSIYYLDIFFILFITIKLLVSLVDITLPNYSNLLTSHTLGVVTGLLQLIYSYILMKISSKKIKHLWFYGCLLFGSSIFLIFGPYMKLIFVMSIGSTYILSRAFYEFEDIIPVKKSRL